MPPMSGTMPHFISITAKRASGAAMRISAPSASCMPAPKQTPWIAAITGSSIRCQIIATSCHWFVVPSPWLRGISISAGSLPIIPESPVMSIPAQKARPSPESTTQRASEAATSCPAAMIASIICWSTAFILSARTRRTWAMWFS